MSDIARIKLEPENIWELENSEKVETFDFRNFGGHVIFPRQNAWKSRFVKFQNKKLIEQLLSISGISRLPEDGLNMEIVLNEYFDLFFTRSNSDNLQQSWPLWKLEIASRDFARNSKEEKSIKTSTVFFAIASHFSGFPALESDETKEKNKIYFVLQQKLFQIWWTVLCTTGRKEFLDSCLFSLVLRILGSCYSLCCPFWCFVCCC